MTLKYSSLILLAGLTLQACSSSVTGQAEATRYGTYYEAGAESYGAYGVQGQNNCGVSFHHCGYVNELRAVPSPAPAPVMAPPMTSAPVISTPTWTEAPAAPTYTPSTPLETVLPPLPATPYVPPSYPASPEPQDYRPYRK